MPKKRETVTVTYECNICGHEHGTRRAALDCEQRGIAKQLFKKFDVVELKGLSVGEKIRFITGDYLIVEESMLPLKAIVLDTYIEEDEVFNPHEQCRVYEIRLFKKVSRDQLKQRTDIAYFAKEYLKRVESIDEKTCPLCGAETTQEEELGLGYMPHSSFHRFLENVKYQKCTNCGSRFFTEEQSAVIENWLKEEKK